MYSCGTAHRSAALFFQVTLPRRGSRVATERWCCANLQRANFLAPGKAKRQVRDLLGKLQVEMEAKGMPMPEFNAQSAGFEV